MATLLNGLTSLQSAAAVVDNTPATWTPAGEANTVTYSSVSLAVENHVTPTSKEVPLTGLYSIDDEIAGWKWDRRRLEEQNILATQHNDFLGGHTAGLLDGSKLLQWQSGTLRGGEYKRLSHLRSGEFLTWTPVFTTGEYSFFHDVRTLFSDYSYSTSFSTNAVENGAMYHVLDTDAVTSTVEVSMYSRDKKSRIFKKIAFDRVDSFTGVISGTERVATESSGNILWDQLETRKHEFIIRDGKVWLNADYSVSVGKVSENLTFDTPSPLVFDIFLEKAGSGVGEGRDIFTRLFPIQAGTVRVLSKDAANNTDEWTEVENLYFSTPTDKHFSVDSDLGIITVGGFKAPNLTLSEDLGVTDTEIAVYRESESMGAYPEQGVLVIGSEEIAYYGKTSDSFTNCIRGFNDTVAASATVGTKVEDRQHGQGTSNDLYVCYTAVPRIEYETTGYDCRTANKSRWLDLRPGANVITNELVQILSADPNLDKVVLETDTPLIGGQLHGPLFYGTDISRLTARGLDSLGNPVEDIDLTISILSGSGFLNGFLTSVTSTTNSLGEIYAFYNSPYNKDGIEHRVGSVTHDGADTLMTINGLDSDPLPTEIWVYQVLKHDPVVGSVGNKLAITAASASTDIPNAAGYIEVDGLIDEMYDGGRMYVLGTDSILRQRNIIKVINLKDGDYQDYSRIYLNNVVASGVTVGQDARLYQPDAIEWNAGALNGARRILYEWNTEVEHPITGDLGAYYPLQPDSVSGNTLRFIGRNLPLPDSADVDNNLGAYVVVAPGKVKFQARGRDPVSGRVVQSNIIEIGLQLPAFLSGVDKTGVLPIPYGWTLVTDEFNVGSGIGGANFLTINPAADGINQFSLLGVF